MKFNFQRANLIIVYDYQQCEKNLRNILKGLTIHCR